LLLRVRARRGVVNPEIRVSVKAVPGGLSIVATWPAIRPAPAGAPDISVSRAALAPPTFFAATG
jgi:hypothetical protein